MLSNRKVRLFKFLIVGFVFLFTFQMQEELKAVINNLQCVIRFRLCCGNITRKGLGKLSID